MTSLQIPINLPTLTSFSIDPNSKSCCLGLGFYQRRRKIEFLYKNRWITKCSRERWSFGEVGFGKDGILMRRKRKDGSILVRANQGFGFNGGGGGGGSDKGNSSRVLGNLAFAVGLTYLSMTGQLGWILDAIVSIWLIAVLLPIVGLGAFFWYAGRDIVQSSCPNCGNDFQILKSSLKDGIQLCPFCTQPFSVQGNQFVREPTKFSSGRSTSSGQVFNGFSPRSGKGKASSTAVVDIEAEVKDAD